jgi:hypothetical protein
MCETNPICPPASPPGGCRAGAPNPRRAERLSCETNPISAVVAVESPHYSSIPSFQHSNPLGAGRDEATGAWDEGANAQNEPNLRGGAGLDAARGPWDAGQMCETNPIRPGLTEVGTLWGPKMRNEPNFSIADCGQICGGTPALRPTASGPRGSNVRNEPNLARPGQRWVPADERCKTNPFCSAPPEKAGGGQGRKCCRRRG